MGTDGGENVSMQYVCVFITAGPITKLFAWGIVEDMCSIVPNIRPRARALSLILTRALSLILTRALSLIHAGRADPTHR